jgi:nucleotide-binding universal stress UspA family protein
MIKHILVPTDGSEQAEAGVRYAVAFAQHCGAMLHGLHVVDIKLLEGPFLRDISASLGTAPYMNHQGNIALILEERGHSALKAFESECAQAGVSCDTDQVTGLVVSSILEKSELADLIILGRQGEHGEWIEGLMGSTAQAVARRARRPVLVTDRDTPGQTLFVVAYDGSQHARRALQVAAQFSTIWKAPLHVLTVDERRPEEILDEARNYLAPHEITAQYIAQDGDPSERIVEYARENSADLLMMGAYGHSKVRELIVGSATAYAMNHAPCPILLAR